MTDVLPQGLLIVALLAATAYGLWRGRAWSFAGVWFFLILAPTSSVLPLGTEIAGERRMYLPTVAVVALAVLGGRWALLEMGRRLAWRASSVRLAGVLAVVCVATAQTWATVARNATYQDDVAIYADAAAKRPNNARVLMNLGTTLARRGDLAAAREVLEKALRLRPDYADAHYNLGVVDLREGRAADAARRFAAATKSRPDWPQLYVTVADLLAHDGHLDAAREMYAKARALAERAGQERLVAEVDAKVAAMAAGPTK